MQPRGRVWVPVPAQPLLPGSDFGNDFGILKSSIADGLWVAITKGNENNAAKAEGEFMFDSYCVVKACEPDSFLWHSCVYQQNKFLEWGWFNLYRAVVITKSRLCRLVSLSANCGKFSEGLGEVQKCIKKKKTKPFAFLHILKHRRGLRVQSNHLHKNCRGAHPAQPLQRHRHLQHRPSSPSHCVLSHWSHLLPTSTGIFSAQESNYK